MCSVYVCIFGACVLNLETDTDTNVHVLIDLLMCDTNDDLFVFDLCIMIIKNGNFPFILC